MTISTAVCIVLCTLIVSTATIFIIAYLSELKHEKQLRQLYIEKIHKMLSNKPIMLVDSVAVQDNTPQVKNKKNIN